MVMTVTNDGAAAAALLRATSGLGVRIPLWRSIAQFLLRPEPTPTPEQTRAYVLSSTKSLSNLSISSPSARDLVPSLVSGL